MKNDVLKGIRVVDFTTYAAAPGAGRIMADWGAEVIKVEGIFGDPMRQFGLQMAIPATDEENPIWEQENGNKKGVTIDIKNPKGHELMIKLIQSADIFITNVRMSSLVKMGLDYESLEPICPKLVWGHVSGYGVYGPEAPRPGYDVVSYWSRGGSLVDTSVIGHPPMNPPYGVGDHTTSLVLLSGVLGGLNKVRTTGKGEKIEVSLFGTAVWVNSLMVISAQYGDQWPKDRYMPSSPLSTTYRCADDGSITLTVLAYERYWKAFCEAMEIPEYISDERYSTLISVKKPGNCSALVHILEDTFAKKDCAYWSKRLKAADIAFERANHYSDISKDEQAIANHYVEKFTMKNGKSCMLPMSPVQFKYNEAPELNPAPLLGQDNVSVFKSLGYSDEEIADLKLANAIG